MTPYPDTPIGADVSALPVDGPWQDHEQRIADLEAWRDANEARVAAMIEWEEQVNRYAGTRYPPMVDAQGEPYPTTQTH